MWTKEAFIARYMDWRTEQPEAALQVVADLRAAGLAPGLEIVAVRVRTQYAVMLKAAAELTAAAVPDVEILREGPPTPDPRPPTPPHPEPFWLESVFGNMDPAPDQFTAMMQFMVRYGHYVTNDLAEARAERARAGGHVGDQPIVIMEVLGHYTLMPEGPARLGAQLAAPAARIVPDDEAAAPGTRRAHVEANITLHEKVPVPSTPPRDAVAQAIYRANIYPVLANLAGQCKAAGLPCLFLVQIGGMADPTAPATNGVISLNMTWQSDVLTRLQGLAEGTIPLPHVTPPKTND